MLEFVCDAGFVPGAVEFSSSVGENEDWGTGDVEVCDVSEEFDIVRSFVTTPSGLTRICLTPTI